MTTADRYSGPAVTERLAAEGAVVVGDTGRYQDPDESGRVVADAGRIDVLVVNLIARWKPTSAVETTDGQWTSDFIAGQIVPFTGGWVTST